MENNPVILENVQDVRRVSRKQKDARFKGGTMGELGKEIKRVEEDVPNLIPEKRPQEAPEPQREKVPVPVRTR